MDEIKKFEIGKTYYDHSACNHDCIFSYTVVRRTAKTLVLRDQFGEIRRRRIFLSGNVENVMPQGSYSMAPILSADRELVDPAAPDPEQLPEIPQNIIDFVEIKKKREKEQKLNELKEKIATEILPNISADTIKRLYRAAQFGNREEFGTELERAILEAMIRTK